MQGTAYLGRVLEGVNSSKSQQVAISTFENHRLAGELTFGDSFQDSGVVPRHVRVRSSGLRLSIPMDEG